MIVWEDTYTSIYNKNIIQIKYLLCYSRWEVKSLTLTIIDVLKEKQYILHQPLINELHFNGGVGSWCH